jgi:hypothetical protein
MMRKVDETYTRLRELEKEIAEKMKDIDLKAGEFAISGPFEEMLVSMPNIRCHSVPEERKRIYLNETGLFMRAPALQIPGTVPFYNPTRLCPLR